MPPQIGSIYRHYKSTEWDDYTYEVVGLAVHSETLEDMVIYKMFYDSHDSPWRKWYPKWTLFVRPLSMWEELVECYWERVSRFSLVRD